MAVMGDGGTRKWRRIREKRMAVTGDLNTCVRPGCRGVKTGKHCESPSCTWLRYACGAIYSLTVGYGWGCSTNPDNRERRNL